MVLMVCGYMQTVVSSVFLTRHITSASINLVTRRVTLASTSTVDATRCITVVRGTSTNSLKNKKIQTIY